MERAKQLREERKNAISSNDTFTPQINPPRRMSSGNVGRGDSLDNLTTEVSASRPVADDPMEMPLPGQRNRQQHDTGFEGAPSPGSDALGKELKRYGGAPQPHADIQPRNLNNTHFKSKFMQQYDQPENTNTMNNQRAAVQQKAPQPDPDDVFMNQLRGGDQRSNGPGWNDDTSFGGFDSSNASTAKRSGPAGRGKVSRPSVHRVQQQNDSQYDEGGNDATPPRVTPRGAGVQTKLTPRTAGEVRSNLSLLKSKIRQSESAGNPARANSLSGSGRNFAGSGGFEPEDEFQSSMGARQPSTNYSRNSSKASVGGGMGHGSSNTSFNSFASAYEDPPEEQPVARNRATRPRPRGIADQSRSNYQDEEEAPQVSYSNARQAAPPRQPQPPAQQRNNPTGGYEPSVGAGRNLSNGRSVAAANPPANRNQPPAYNPSPSSPSIDDLPAVASGGAKAVYRLPPDAFPDPDDDEGGDEGPQMECPTCGRKFNPTPFQKHIKVCEKVFLKKRKAFDSTKMRIQDNPELVKMYSKSKKEEDRAARKAAMMAEKQAAMAAGRAAGGGGGFRAAVVQEEEENFIVAKPKQKLPAVQDKPVGNGEPEPLWKQQSKAFREAMKAARAVKIAQETGAPLPPVMPSAPDPSLVPCPHCGRRFNQKAAERHIPQCQNIKAKPSTLKRGSGINAANGVGQAASSKGKGRF